MPDTQMITQPVQAISPLTCKLAAIMKAVERVPKRGRNAFHGYQYATEADVADTVRAELSSRNVMIYGSVNRVDSREAEGDNGKKSNFVTVEMAFTIVDGDSGEERAFTWAGAGQDRGEKGLFKAITGAEKYFLLKLFLIPTGDDPEDDSRDHKTTAHANVQAQAHAAASAPVTRHAGDEPDDPFDDMDGAADGARAPRTTTLHLGPSNGSPLVSEARAKRCFAIGSKALGGGPQLKDWLRANTPYSDPREILVAHYDTICNTLEAMKAAS